MGVIEKIGSLAGTEMAKAVNLAHETFQDRVGEHGHTGRALGETVRTQLHHLHDLEKRLGRSLSMAVRQHLSFSRDDLWKLHELEKDAARRDLKA